MTSLALPYKAVFVDLDGTLLAPGAVLSPRNAAAVKALVEHGVKVVVATGRPIESVRMLLGPVHASHPAITLSGSMVHQSLFGESLSAQTIPFDTVRRILASCQAMEGVDNILLDESEGFYALHDSPEMEEFAGMYNKRPMPFQYDAIPSAPVLSILIHAKDARRSIYEALQHEYAEAVHFTYFKEYPWIELSHFHSNKGNAMALVCEHFGFGVDEVIAIGDAANDVEMLAAAGLGIAMDNADIEIKKLVDRIAPHHAEDGFAQVMGEIFGLPL